MLLILHQTRLLCLNVFCCTAGHAVVLVGYDNDNMAWLALNSWVSDAQQQQQHGACSELMQHKSSSRSYEDAVVQE
jgi:hypothetical protein